MRIQGTEMSEKINLPVLNNTSQKPDEKSIACSSCGSGGCCGGFGIRAGSEKEVVFRNIFLYLFMGIVIFVVSYLIMQIVSTISG